IKDDGTATVTMELGSMEADEIQASDMNFNGAAVKEFSPEGDDRLRVTLDIEGANNAEEAADKLSGLEYSVGDAQEVAIFSDPSVWSIVENTEFKDGKITATFDLYAEYGKFADSLAADKIKLTSEGAKAESITRTDDQTAQLVITLPAGSMTKDDFCIFEMATLPAGMLIGESGAPAEEITEILVAVDEKTLEEQDSETNAAVAASVISFMPLPGTGDDEPQNNANNANANNANGGGAHYREQNGGIMANVNGGEQRVGDVNAADGYVNIELTAREKFDLSLAKARKERAKKLAEKRVKKAAGVKAIGDYTLGTAANMLSGVNEKAASAVTLAQRLFDIGIGVFMGANGDIAGFATAMDSTVKILQFAGVLPTQKEVTLADLQDKIMEVNGLVRDLSTKVDKLSTKLALSDWKANDAKLRKLEDDLESMDAYLDLAAIIADELGFPAPTENITEEDAKAYQTILASIVKKYEKEGVADFQGASKVAENVKDDFEDAVVAFSYAGEQNPLCSFDEWWNARYNWDSQAYSIKSGYKMGVDFDLTHAYCNLHVWYQIDKFPTAFTGSLRRYEEAKKAISSHSSGPSPDEVKKKLSEHQDINLHSSSLGFTSHYPRLVFSLFRSDGSRNDNMMEPYRNLLDGRTVKKDLDIAGLSLLYDKTFADWINSSKNVREPRGIGFRVDYHCTNSGLMKLLKNEYEYDTWVRYMTWEGDIKSEKCFSSKALGEGPNRLLAYDDTTTYNFTFIWLFQ
ncbi:MAG: hypothetical protein Q4B54_07975, partial [Coriobacteriales bacterium]|nr:hypothetical protein [Coriobacteriales bacterium]